METQREPLIFCETGAGGGTVYRDATPEEQAIADEQRSREPGSHFPVVRRGDPDSKLGNALAEARPAWAEYWLVEVDELGDAFVRGGWRGGDAFCYVENRAPKIIADNCADLAEFVAIFLASMAEARPYTEVKARLGRGAQ